MEPKHQFAAQYVLQRAASERREREALLAAAMSAGMPVWGNFSMGGMGDMGMAGSPTYSDASTRILSLGKDHQTNQMDFSLSSMSRFPGFHTMLNQTSLKPASQEMMEPLRAGSLETGTCQQMLILGQEQIPAQEHMRSHYSQDELRGQFPVLVGHN